MKKTTRFLMVMALSTTLIFTSFSSVLADTDEGIDTNQGSPDLLEEQDEEVPDDTADALDNDIDEEQSEELTRVDVSVVEENDESIASLTDETVDDLQAVEKTEAQTDIGDVGKAPTAADVQEDISEDDGEDIEDPEDEPLETPVITASRNISAGSEITWTAVTDAVSYTLMYKTADTDWSTVANNLTATSYKVPKDILVSGTKYYYAVKAFGQTEEVCSELSNTKAQTYVETPTVKSVTNKTSGVTVTWGSVKGATSYILMYKKSGGSWSTLASDITATSYTVPKSKLTNNIKYYFTVKAKGAGTSGYTSGKSITFLNAPTVTATKNVFAGTQITWSKVSGAKSYTVMYKKDGGSWATAKSGLTTTTYTMPKSKLTSGTKYYYTVKAVNGSESGYTSGKAQTFIAGPTVKSASIKASGVTVSWGKVTGAKTYTVMYKVKGGSWKTAKSGITGTSYTVPKSKLTSGKTYYFTVKAVGNATSGYSSGKSTVWVAAPTGVKCYYAVDENGADSSYLEWKKVDGADGYYLYARKSVNDSWKKIKTIKASDAWVKSGNTLYYDLYYVSYDYGNGYYYNVKAYKGSTKSVFNSTKGYARRVEPELIIPDTPFFVYGYGTGRITSLKVTDVTNISSSNEIVFTCKYTYERYSTGMFSDLHNNRSMQFSYKVYNEDNVVMESNSVRTVELDYGESCTGTFYVTVDYDPGKYYGSVYTIKFLLD